MAQSPKTPPEPENQSGDVPLPVFDRAADDLPWPQDGTLNADDEGNVLPGNDPLDEDPNDNGPDEQFDPEDIRRRKGLEKPLVE
jgi:hypothetical protein